jgi:hypothetical protein
LVCRQLGNLAFVFGLIFSALAFWFAKRASNAAREARNAVLRRTMGEDFRAACRTTGELLMHVENERGDMALLRVRDLLGQMSYAIARWGNRLSPESRSSLLTVQQQFQSIHDVLTKRTLAEFKPRRGHTFSRSASARMRSSARSTGVLPE